MQITLYNQPNFGGTSQQLPVGRHDVDVLMQTGGIGNDQLGSLRVPDGLLVKLFRHKEYTEPLSTYRTDVPNVTNEDTSTSSLVVELLPGYYYYLKAEHSSSVLDVSFASKEEEAKLIQHRRHSGENQQFEFTPLEDGSYTISNCWSQKVLSVKGSSSEPQAGIVQQTWADQHHQRWTLVGQPGGSYKFVNKLSGKTIDIQGGSTNDSAAAIQNTDADSRSQRFFIEPVAVKPKPVNLMITSPSPICWAELADLSAPAITAGSDVGDLTYFLDEAAQQPVVTPNAVGSGTCYIRLTTPDGRAVVKPVEILVRDKPGLTVVPPAPCCADKTVNLVTTVTSPIGPADKLEFFQDKAFTQFLSDPTRIGQSGTYYIRLTDEHGCSVSASVEVVVNALPKLEVLASEWAYRGETVDLTAPHITKGSESGTLACFGPNDPQVPLTPEQATSVGAGTYYLQLTETNGFKSALTAISVTLEERPSLAVPIHADGQYIQKKTPCAAPRIDFSRLPYYDGTCDINPYTPYVGEELEAVPFTDGAFALQPGVHLHWALPDFLTRSFRYPLLQLEALRRATRTNWLGEPQPNGELFDQLYTYFREKGWVKEIPGNAVYASILADKEAIDVAISEGLGSTDPDKQPLAHEILRVRSLLEPGGTQMPPVPNRWRVVRVGGDGPAKTWVVESDFLRESGLGDHQTGVSFPDYTPKLAPFGWLGR
ncbi:MAG: RICIN domain-containing protein [Spirosoma sp.]|nr:RICIN domain-containing protein [Spirosoma sp.]